MNKLITSAFIAGATMASADQPILDISGIVKAFPKEECPTLIVPKEMLNRIEKHNDSITTIDKQFYEKAKQKLSKRVAGDITVADIVEMPSQYEKNWQFSLNKNVRGKVLRQIDYKGVDFMDDPRKNILCDYEINDLDGGVELRKKTRMPLYQR